MFISVVMAVYNGEDNVQSAVQSVLSQTYPHFELIIVNDGSTDRTKEILNTIRNERVIVIHSTANQGAASSLNLGIEQARGDWIAIHDADDLSVPFKLEEQVQYLRDHPKSIGVGSLIRTIPGKSSLMNRKHLQGEEDYYNQIFPQNTILNQRFFTCYLCHGTVVFSKKAFYEAGRYNPAYQISYDYDLWLRLFAIEPIQKVPQVLYYYRIDQDSLGKADTSKTIAELMAISTSSIVRQLREKIKKSPRLAIIGPKKGCAFFKENVESKNKFKIRKYLVSGKKRDWKQAYILYKKGKIDAVVVLNSARSTAVIKFLIKRGMDWNINLFKVWNYRY